LIDQNEDAYHPYHDNQRFIFSDTTNGKQLYLRQTVNLPRGSTCCHIRNRHHGKFQLIGVD
jgi:hypothetical protein